MCSDIVCICSYSDKCMSSTNISGQQTIGIPMTFIRENSSWFRCCHEKCYYVVHDQYSEKKRILWNFRDRHWEAALATGGWKFVLEKLKPKVGDVVEFRLMFNMEAKLHYFRVQLSGNQLTNAQGRFQVGSS
ncbi:hypothetical protein ACFE04_014272 [Oxalis oulophora]